MATYSKEDFERIATAIGKDAADVAAHQLYFESAATLFRLDRGSASPASARPPGTTPHQMRRKMQQISKTARRLLKNLGVPENRGVLKIEEAYDGPGDNEILKVLSWSVDHDEDRVITATRKVGRLAEILKAVEAANDFEQWARRGAHEVTKFGQLTVPKEHQGDVAANDWLAAMLTVYKRITGKDPGTSIGAPGGRLRGKATGPLIRFLAAAEKPLGLQHSAESLRDRVRDILKSGRRRTK